MPIVSSQCVVGSDLAGTAVSAEVLILAGHVLRVHPAWNLGHMTGQASARTRGTLRQDNRDFLVPVYSGKFRESRAGKTQRGVGSGCLGQLRAGGRKDLAFMHMIRIDRENASSSLYHRM